MQVNIDIQKELKPLYETMQRLERKLDTIAPLMKGDLLDDHQLKEMFGISSRTIFDWRNSGKLHYVKIGKVIFYTKEQVIDFINSHKSNHAAKYHPIG